MGGGSLSANRAAEGGGLSAYESPLFPRCYTAAAASDGEALCAAAAAPSTLVNVTVAANTAGSGAGGGLLLEGGVSLEIVGGSLRDNSALLMPTVVINRRSTKTLHAHEWYC